MGKNPTYPTLFDETITIRISKLKEWNYLKQGLEIKTSLIWSRNGTNTNSVFLRLNTESETPFIELSYVLRGKVRKYKVSLITVPSNLGKGLLWFFLCPITGKRCRILYFINGFFLHRDAFKGCFYQKQTQSKYYRKLCKEFGKPFEDDEAFEEIYSKYFKKYYRGKPTRRYLRLMKKIGEEI